MMMKEFKNKLSKAVALDAAARKGMSAAWKEKLDTLKEKKGKTRAEFYAENDLNQYMMIRYINGSKLATWDFIAKVEKALRKALK
jgi:hypothetical protein